MQGSVKLLAPFFAILGFMLCFLSVYVIRLRRKHKVVIQNGDSLPLKYAIRAQGNFIEYTPIAMMLLLVLCFLQVPAWSVCVLAAFYTVGRFFHAYGLLVMEQCEKPSYRGRIGGMFLTFFVLGISSILVLFFAII